jgi:thiol-disulfide isomerase/thioredoxin
MTKLMLRVVIMLAAGGIAWAQCEIPASVREILDQPVMRQTPWETEAQKDARTAAFKNAMARYPDSYFLLRAQMMTLDPEERIRWAGELLRQNPDKPVYALLDAESLLGKDTREAIRRFEAVKTAHPEIPNVYLSLASAQSSGKFLDRAKAQKELDGYISRCSQSISLDGLFLNLIQQIGTPEQLTGTAAAIRKRLETDPQETRTTPWERLWSLEFKANSVSEHPAVRKRIGDDLAKFEKSPRRREISFIEFLKSGYESLGDQTAVDRLNEEILKSHPLSAEAKQIVRQQWSDKHPWPGQGDKTALQAYTRTSLAAARAWHKRWPADSMILHTIFTDLSRLPDTTGQQIASAVDALMAAYRKDASWTTSPPMEFRIAQEYIKHNMRLLQVPSLIKQGDAAMNRMYQPNLTDDRMDEEARAQLRDALDRMHIEAAHILLDCYAVTKQPLKAKEVLADLASIDSSKQPMNWEMLSLRAQVAEIEGRKLDALMMYRRALDERGPSPPRIGPDKLVDNFQRLWKQMGGTQEGLGLPAEKKKIAESTESRWVRSKSTLPPFSLKDFEGRSWSLAKLGGKVLLINVWATWCGPCVAEHPEFQKLYDKLKTRSDIAVLSFNVDEDIGKVTPYIARNGYTFPVIPAADLVKAVKSSLAIPQNWLVNPEGKLEWEQIGFSTDDTKWQESIEAKIEELVKR